MAIHAPTHIPSFPDGFVQLKPKTVAVFKFRWKEWLLLQWPYGTECGEYPNTDYKSHYDCLTNCQMREFNKICGNCKPYDWVLRMDQMRSDDKFCPDFKFGCSADEGKAKQLFSVNPNCMQDCKAQCRSLEIKYNVLRSINFDLEVDTSIVILTKGSRNKDFKRYKPAMSLANYVANIGGIGSFWIGLNVLGAYDITVFMINFISNKYRLQNK